MNRRHTIAASLIASAALTIVTVATTAGAQSADLRVHTRHAPSSTTPTSSEASVATNLMAAQQARSAQHSRSVEKAAAVYAAAYSAAKAKAAQDAVAAEKFAALAQAHTAVQGGMWACIRVAESGGNYADVSGAYGILISSWNAYSYVWAPYGSWSVPGEAPPAVQDLVAYRLYQVGGGFGGWNDRCTGR